MVKKLRIRFVLYSLLSFVSVMVIILVAINVTNNVNSKNVLKTSAESISSAVEMSMPQEETGEVPERPAGVNQPANNIERLPRFIIYNLVDETYDYNFYGAIADLDEITEAISIVDSLNGENGLEGNYYYQFDGDNLYLVDATQVVTNLESTLRISLWVFLGALLLVTMLIIPASKRLVQPFVTANKKQKEFITNASHELKTPLTIINTDNTLLEMDFGENEQTKSIERQVKRLTNLTNDLVSLSRLDEGVSLNKKEFELSSIIKSLCLDFYIEATAKGKELEVTTENFKYTGDSSLLKKLVSILIDNALKYADPKSTVTLVQKGNVITVSNSVLGIKPGDKSQFFERFYRADQSRASIVRGHGIGLSLAKSIVELHKGKIEASSNIENIFTVKVTL